MNTVRNFEDLMCWQKAKELVILVYSESSKGVLARDFGTRDQLRRAALSVMNNIAEGFGRYSPKEFIRFLDFAQSSSMEVKSITYVLEAMNYLPLETIEKIRSLAEEAKALIRGLISHLRSRILT
jgi:four helix bundle protein